MYVLSRIWNQTILFVASAGFQTSSYFQLRYDSPQHYYKVVSSFQEKASLARSHEFASMRIPICNDLETYLKGNGFVLDRGCENRVFIKCRPARLSTFVYSEGPQIASIKLSDGYFQ